MLGRWLGTAHSDENQGFQGSMDSRPFRPYRHRFARKASSKHDPKMIQPKAMYQSWLLDTLIGCSRLVGGSGRRIVAIIRTFTDQWIPGPFGHFVIGSYARQAQDLIEDDPAQSNVSALVLGRCDGMLPPGRRLGTANSGKNQGFHGSMESLPFWSRPPRYTCKAILRPVFVFGIKVEEEYQRQ